MSETKSVSSAAASRLVIVATQDVRATVEQLKELFKDLQEPLIEEIPEKLDLSEHYSSIQFAQSLENTVFYGHRVRFQTLEDARAAIADYNHRIIPGSPHPGCPITIFQAGPEYLTSEVTAKDKNKIIRPPYPSGLFFMLPVYISWLVASLQTSYASAFSTLGASSRFKSILSSNLPSKREVASSNLTHSAKRLDDSIQLHSSELLDAIERLRRDFIAQHGVPSRNDKPLVQDNGDTADSGISNVLGQMKADVHSQNLRSVAIQEDLDDLKKSMNDDHDSRQGEISKFVHLQELLVAKERVAQLEILAIKTQFSEFQRATKRATDDIAAREKELDDVIQSVCKLTREIGDLQNKVSFQEASVNAEKAKWETELQAYSARIRELETTNKALESSFTSITADSASIRSEADAARNALQTATGKYQKQVEGLNTSINQLQSHSSNLKDKLAKSELSVNERSAECERWRLQCQVSDAEITRLRGEIEGIVEQQKIESQREESLKNRIETKYGRYGQMDQLVFWSDQKAYDYLTSTLDHYEKSSFNKETPLTLKGVPWPVLDDPRWLFALSNIQRFSVETCLRGYWLTVAKKDKEVYTTFLCRLKAVFHPDKWNPNQRLSTVWNPEGYVEAGLVVTKVVEAELDKLLPVPKVG